MRKRLKAAALLCVAYSAGIAIACIFHGLRAVRVVRIHNRHRIPRRQRSMLIVANHPSLVEPFLIPSLFVSEWSLNTFWAPWSTPDAENFRKKWYWGFWIAAARSVLMPRGGDVVAVKAAFDEIAAVLKRGGRAVLFLEGGRTRSGRTHVFSKSGKALRPLKSRFGDVVIDTGASVLPLWIEWSRGYRILTIKVGELMTFPEATNRRDIALAVQKRLLELADED